jgi:V8-like Glu-specific endopeptidase
MKITSPGRLSMTTLFVLAFFAVALACAPGMAWAASPVQVVASKDTTNLAASVQNYWTEARLQAAKPMPMPVVSGTEQAALAELGNKYVPDGPPVLERSGKPGTSTVNTLGLDVSALLDDSSIEPLFGTSPFSYTRYRNFPDNLAEYQTFPHSTIGKLFFTIPGQGNYVCSAAVVNSTNLSVVWTAGHCVYTPGVGFHTNFSFSPARRAASNPYGLWTAKKAFTLEGWQQNKLQYDHGALVMNRLSGVRIGTKVGFLGFAANLPRQQHWHLAGYPAAARNLGATPSGAQFDGEHLELCSATYAANDNPAPGTSADPNTIGVGCDQTGGTSGGPWIKDYSGVNGTTNLLNGNNSYRYDSGTVPDILRLYGPYFTTGAVNLRNTAQAVSN